MRYPNVTKTWGTALALSLIASSAGAAPRYGHANLFGSGYSDRQVGPETWDVRGSSATLDGGHAIALYRAAELARTIGATELRIIRQRIMAIHMTDRRGMTVSFVREVAKLRVRAVQSDADRTACEEAEARRCVTIPVARLLAQFGPSLGQDAGPYAASELGRPAVQVGIALPAAFLAQVKARSDAQAPVAITPAPARPLSPYQLGRLQGRAALAASGQRVDDWP